MMKMCSLVGRRCSDANLRRSPSESRCEVLSRSLLPDPPELDDAQIAGNVGAADALSGPEPHSPWPLERNTYCQWARPLKMSVPGARSISQSRTNRLGVERVVRGVTRPPIQHESPSGCDTPFEFRPPIATDTVATLGDHKDIDFLIGSRIYVFRCILEHGTRDTRPRNIRWIFHSPVRFITTMTVTAAFAPFTPALIVVCPSRTGRERALRVYA